MIPQFPDTPICDAVENGWSGSLKENEVEILVSTIRSNGGKCGDSSFGDADEALTRDGSLWCAARIHSQDMGTRFMDDNGSNGSTPADRASAALWTGGEVIQTVAVGYQNPQQVVDAWRRRPELCAKLLDPDVVSVGVGVFESPENGESWTIVLGKED